VTPPPAQGHGSALAGRARPIAEGRRTSASDSDGAAQEPCALLASQPELPRGPVLMPPVSSIQPIETVRL
jgi:hypothetical protein